MDRFKPRRGWRRQMWGVIVVCILAGHLWGCSYGGGATQMRPEPDQEVAEATSSFPMPWLEQSPQLWQRDFSGSPRNDDIPQPSVELDSQNIGTATRVYDLFDRWTLREEIAADRGKHYADITDECQGLVELNFALTPQQWQDGSYRIQYYRAVDDLIETIGQTLLADFGDRLQGEERELFLRALKTLAWQESRWQHYLRYKEWFFVLVSGGSYNALDDWGITQIARSSFQPQVRLNENFFASRGYCSISSSLYYGFMEYYFCYLEARDNPENGSSLFNKIVGAYNRYCSGYSSSCFDLAKTDQAFRQYQIRALGSFKDKFILTPWEAVMIP